MIRKKIITIMLILILFFTNAVSAATVSSDSDVQQAYDEYLLLVNAYNGTSYTDLSDAYGAFLYTTEIINDDELKSEEWTKVVTDNVGLTEFLDVTITSAMIIEIAEAKSDYENDKNVRTAFEFVNKYNEDIDATNKLGTMDSSLVTVYSEALTLLPSDDTIYVKEEFNKIKNELDYGIIEDTIKIYEESKLIETYNTLTSDEKNQLAVMLELSVEELDGVVNYWWSLFEKVAKVLIEFEDYNNALTIESAYDFAMSIDEFLAVDSRAWGALEGYFDATGNYENAKKLIEAYEAFKDFDKNATEENAETLINVVNEMFDGKVDDLEDLIPNISKKYAEAIKIVTSDKDEGKTGNVGETSTPDDGKQEGNNNTGNTGSINTGANNNDTIGDNPQTGDNIVLFTILSLVSIIGIAVTVKVKKYVK